MKHFRVALYPGDGIGREVLTEAVRVLDCVQASLGDFRLETAELPWGSDYYFKHGELGSLDA